MDLEDLEPKTKTPKLRDLDRMSVEELNEYLAVLQAEILRVRAKVDAKTAYLASVAALFKGS